MVIFLNDDRAYSNWVIHHRQGFVIDGHRKPRSGHLILHRADCPSLKSRASKRIQWTTGNKFKACSHDREDLEAWADDEGARSMELCPTCRPKEDNPTQAVGEVHLTRLGSDILDFVLDAAVIHLEHEHPPYRLTVSEIAACFGKTAGQLQPVLHRLLDAGFIFVPGVIDSSTTLSPKRIVLPTKQALQTLEAFQAESDEAIATELAKLMPE